MKKWILAALTIVLVVSLLFKGGAFTRATTASATGDSTTETEEETVDPADELAREFLSANVDKKDVDEFYAKLFSSDEFKTNRTEAIIMENTWPGLAQERKDNSAAVHNGQGLYGAVEFPVDIPLLETEGSNYRYDHEEGYTEAQLKVINEWIVEHLKSGDLTDEEEDAVIHWTITRIALDPTYCNMWAQTFAELHSQSGKSGRELSEDLDEFLTHWENGDRLEYYTCRWSDDPDHIRPTEEFQKIGFEMAITFSRFTVVSFGTPTARHWYMEEISTVPSKTTTVEAAKHESEAAFILAALDKDGKNVFKERIALNALDGRSEIIVNVSTGGTGGGSTPESPDSPKPPTPPTPPGDTPPDDPPPDNPPDNPPPTNPPKDPAKDPVNNGNAEKGGGDNKPDDGPGEYQPVDPRTENPTGNENDNNHGHSDPSTVTPETPSVVPEHQNDSDVVTPMGGENQMNYQPDPVTERGPVDSSTTQTPPTASDGDGEFVVDD